MAREHDPTTLFAGIARQARQRFSVSARQAHVDTTSFSASGAYAPAADDPEAQDPERTRWWAPEAQPPAGERWLVVRTAQGEERARATLARKVEQARAQWEKRLWHLGNRRFACAPDAQAALTAQFKACPAWLVVQAEVQAVPKHARPGRLRKDAPPDHTQW